MADDIITVLRKAPGEPWQVDTVANELQALQASVGGYIETVTLWADAMVICDEEGRLKDYEENCEVCGVDFYGTILIAGVDGENLADVPVDLINELAGQDGYSFLCE